MFEPKPHAIVASRYRLAREIGRGGMGSVWEAFDLELEAPCALKFILNQDAKPVEVRTRFLREARAVARLQSPHVVSVRSVGEWEGALYIAMELLVGETLFQRLTRTTTLSVRETARLVDQVASVLAIAHAAGIVHRDLKPENIWLWSQGDLLVKVLDFGVAKHVLDDGSLLKTATGVLVGTPYYMSPEQAAGDRQVDHRSDLWSLSLIAAECLSGQRPFQGTGLGQVLASIISGAPPDIAKLYPSGNPALQAWWARATAKEPSGRYDSAPTLAREFATALGVGGDLASASSPHQNAVGASHPGTPLAATSSLSPLITGARATQPLDSSGNVWQVTASERSEAVTHTADPAAAGPAPAVPATNRTTNPINRDANSTGQALNAHQPVAAERETVGVTQAEVAATKPGSPRAGRIALVVAAAAAIAIIGLSLGRGRSPESTTSADLSPSAGAATAIIPAPIDAPEAQAVSGAAPSSGIQAVAPRAAEATGPDILRATADVATIAAPSPSGAPSPSIAPSPSGAASAGSSPASPGLAATPSPPGVTAKSPTFSTTPTPVPSSAGLSGAPRVATTAAKPAPTPKPKANPEKPDVDRRIGF